MLDLSEENQVKKEKSSANGANKSENEDDKPLPDELRMEDYDLEDPVAGLGLDDDADSADDEDQYEVCTTSTRFSLLRFLTDL